MKVGSGRTERHGVAGGLRHCTRKTVARWRSLLAGATAPVAPARSTRRDSRSLALAPCGGDCPRSPRKKHAELKATGHRGFALCCSARRRNLAGFAPAAPLRAQRWRHRLRRWRFFVAAHRPGRFAFGACPVGQTAFKLRSLTAFTCAFKMPAPSAQAPHLFAASRRLRPRCSARRRRRA